MKIFTTFNLTMILSILLHFTTTKVPLCMSGPYTMYNSLHLALLLVQRICLPIPPIQNLHIIILLTGQTALMAATLSSPTQLSMMTQWYMRKSILPQALPLRFT